MGGGKEGLKRFEAEPWARSEELEERRFIGSGAEGESGVSRRS